MTVIDERAFTRTAREELGMPVTTVNGQGKLTVQLAVVTVP